MILSAVMCHDGEQSHCEHYASGVKVENFKATKTTMQLKDIGVPYIQIYERMTDFLAAPPVSVNGTAETGPTSELITETVETMI